MYDNDADERSDLGEVKSMSYMYSAKSVRLWQVKNDKFLPRIDNYEELQINQEISRC